VILGQPVTKTRRHQQHLLTITLNEVLGHARIVLNPPDSGDRPQGRDDLCEWSATSAARTADPRNFSGVYEGESGDENDATRGEKCRDRCAGQ
jgi:hypothetical protein